MARPGGIWRPAASPLLQTTRYCGLRHSFRWYSCKPRMEKLPAGRISVACMIRSAFLLISMRIPVGLFPSRTRVLWATRLPSNTPAFARRSNSGSRHVSGALLYLLPNSSYGGNLTSAHINVARLYLHGTCHRLHCLKLFAGGMSFWISCRERYASHSSTTLLPQSLLRGGL